MTSQHDGGALRSRPMTTIDQEYDGSLWFFAKSDADVARALTSYPEVCLSYASLDAADFVCVAGPATVVTDVSKKRQLWKPAVQAWFPEGYDSPTVVLIKVTPNHAEYWDSKDSQLVRLFTLAKAIASGSTPADMGEHRAVVFQNTSQ
jgi:general stress protein 26